MVKTLVRVALAGIPTTIIGILLIQLVNEHRGYEAIGGEWFAVILIFALFYYLVNKFI